MYHAATRALFLVATGLVCLVTGHDTQAHDNHHFRFWFPPPPSPDVQGTWDGDAESSRFGSGTVSLEITSQYGGRFSGTITLDGADDSLLPAGSTAYGRVTSDERISIESYTSAGNFFAHGPIVDGVMQLAYILEQPDGSMDAGLLTMSLTPPPTP